MYIIELTSSILTQLWLLKNVSFSWNDFTPLTSTKKNLSFFYSIETVRHNPIQAVTTIRHFVPWDITTQIIILGASPYKRDFGRGLCALEWAEYCTRTNCAKTIAQFVEACNLGLICTNFFEQQAGNRYRWKSDTNLASSSKESDQTTGCIPFNFLRKVRRSLPSSGSESVFSPLQSMEDIGKCLYSPIFPEYISSATVSRPCNRRRKTIIPKLEVTLTSKDDNYFFESPLPFVRSSTFSYRKFRSDDYSCVYYKSRSDWLYKPHVYIFYLLVKSYSK